MAPTFEPWHEWITHTHFSFKTGASSPSDLIGTAADFGYSGIAVTDFDGVYGLARSYRALCSLKKSGRTAPRLFYGAELHLSQDHDLPIIQQDTLVLVARTHRGYGNLCRLLTHAHRDGKKDAFVSLDHLLDADTSDLIFIKPMRGLIHRAGDKDWKSRIAKIHEGFGPDRFFLAVSRHFSPLEDKAILPTIDLAGRLGVSCLLSQDAFMHRPAEKDLSDLMHAIRLNQRVGDISGHLFVNGERSLHSLRNLEARFRTLPIYESARRSSAQLAESCAFEFSELSYKYPKEMIPEGYSADGYLEKITWEAAAQRYKGGIPDKVSGLLKHELALVKQLGFSHYFLTVWDIASWAKSRQILCQGRGSAANSAICFVLGITAIDPAHFDCLFERFISVERETPPDIDMDFEHERREEVITHIYQRYGRARAAMVANVITFRSRSAFRAAGKALGVPDAIIATAAETLESVSFQGELPPETMNALQGQLEAAGLDADVDEIPWLHWMRMSERLTGFPSHLGIHSGGFVLSDQPLDLLCAQEPATMPGRSVIQWCKEDIEALGFFKVDILALGMLTAIRKCFHLIESHHGTRLSMADIPSDDKRTYDMICRAETVATFQVESRAQMSMLPRLKPRCFYDLVVQVAIIRPGPIQGGMIHPYLRRRDGKEPVHFPHPLLKEILARTLGVPIFQEQVMRIAMTLGNFTPGEADQLRRNMGSFAIKGDLEPWSKKLEAGMRAKGIPQSFIDGIVEQLKGFASYGFPESHAASFALIAYASCYLKAHFPEAFLVSVLNSQPMGFYSPHTIIQTAIHLGIEVLPICVLRSEWDFTLENASTTRHPFAIRMGLRMVRSLRANAGRQLVERRNEHGAWNSLEQFLCGSGLSKVDLSALAAADALKSLGIERRYAVWLAEAAPFCKLLEDPETPVAFPAETAMERIQADFHASSTTLGQHPAEIIKRDAWHFEAPVENLALARDLGSKRVGGQVIIFGMVIVRQAPPAANGMVFATVEDETGMINLALTPQVYAREHLLFERQAFICAKGQLQKKGDAHSIKVERILVPRVKEAEVIFLDSGSSQDAVDSLIKEGLVQSRNYS